MSAPDLIAHLQDHLADAPVEFALADLQAGDLLQVQTQNTRYDFTILHFREATLATNRPNRPTGPVRLQGCTFGLSTTIKPGHLFCGGNLEFTFDQAGEKMTHTTTRILSLHHWRRQSSLP